MPIPAQSSSESVMAEFDYSDETDVSGSQEQAETAIVEILKNAGGDPVFAIAHNQGVGLYTVMAIRKLAKPVYGKIKFSIRIR